MKNKNYCAKYNEQKIDSIVFRRVIFIIHDFMLNSFQFSLSSKMTNNDDDNELNLFDS